MLYELTTTAISIVTHSVLGPAVDGQFYGVASPIPQASIVTSFGSGQTPPVIPTRILTVTPETQPIVFTLPYDSNSNSQPITITNTGNTTCTVTSIVFDNAFIPFYFIVDLSSINFPRLVNPGSSFTFNLIYYLADNGFNLNVPYNINFTINSTADRGPISVKTQLTVVPPVFDFYLTPSSWTDTYTYRDGRIATQSVTVGGKGSFTTITYGTDTNFSSRGFSIKDSTSVVGFDISFNPARLSNGNYITTATIGINGATHTFTAAITLAVPAAPSTRNLGSWLSAYQKDNGVIGASYDIINDVKYITIGFGMGADGGGNVVDTLGANVNIGNLGTGTNADPNFALGPVLYPGPGNPIYSNFLRPSPTGYGVWVNDSGWYPVGVWVSRTYIITTRTSGEHWYVFAADNQAYFIIDNDNNLKFNIAAFTPYRASFYLSAGNHTLTLYFYNANGRYNSTENPGSVALTISDPNDRIIWDSNLPVRTAYRYWNEVCRIPLYDSTATNATFYSKDYLIKNLNPLNGYSYGSYFGEQGTAAAGSMFTVTQTGDPYNDIIIEINKPGIAGDTTTSYAEYLFYYYAGDFSSIRVAPRAQLETDPGAGNPTRYFTGFSRNGSVTTSPKDRPTSFINYPPAGTILSEGCSGTYWEIVYADGNGGTYSYIDPITDIRCAG